MVARNDLNARGRSHALLDELFELGTRGEFKGTEILLPFVWHRPARERRPPNSWHHQKHQRQSSVPIRQSNVPKDWRSCS